MLSISNLYKQFDQRTVLKEVNLHVKKGEVVVILGPSGCGKSTLLRCINGLEKVTQGNIYFKENEITAVSNNWTKTREQIGMVFQSYELFPHLSVLENVILGPVKVQGKSRTDAIKQAESLLDRVSLLERKDDFPRQLSGGQKQRIAIVRALCMNPEILLLDEITASLDPEMVHEVLEVILELSNQGMTMLMVTHELNFAENVADRIVFMNEGEILEITPPKEFFKTPQTERAQHFLNKFNYKKM